MKKGRYEASRKRSSNRSKSLALVLSLVLVIGCVAGGTLAWLNAKTDEVKNTFSTSDISVTLKETKNTYKMIPGWTIDKDPKATVTSGSEDCYLFVKVEKSENFDSFMTYKIADGWRELEDVDGVYYMVFNSKSNEENKPVIGTEYSILKDDQVTVKDTVTKDNMNGLNEENYPTLTFTAYAVQLMKNNDTEFTAAEAWEIAQGLDTNP